MKKFLSFINFCLIWLKIRVGWKKNTNMVIKQFSPDGYLTEVSLSACFRDTKHQLDIRFSVADRFYVQSWSFRYLTGIINVG